MSQASNVIPRALAEMPGARLPAGKQWMALNALSELNCHIAEHPDFYSLINLLLLTICGQYSMANTFAAIRDPRSIAESPIVFATGSMEKNLPAIEPPVLEYFADYFQKSKAPYWNVDIHADLSPNQTVSELIEKEVQIVVPLMRDDQFMGILGMGRRSKPFTAAELELLLLFVHAAAPFMATLSREYFDLFNSVYQGVMLFDTEGQLKRINATALRTMEELSSQPNGIATRYGTPIDQVFADPSFIGWSRELTRVDSSPRGRVVNGLMVKVPSGDLVYSARVSSINRRDDGRCDLLIVLEDVTKKVHQEQHLYELQKFAEQGVMVSSISHELNNHLAVLVGGMQVVESLIEKGQHEKAVARIRKMQNILSNAVRYTAGLTDQSRLNREKGIEQLNEVVAEILSFVQVQRKFKRIALVVELDSRLPILEIDRDQISQLLLNLLYNSAEAIEEADRESGRIQVETMLEQDHVRLTVRDNGAGIPDSVRSRLLKERITTKKTGHGFGLIMCSKVAKDHHAEVQIESEPGRGTTFEFRFPIHSGELAPQQPKPDSGSHTDLNGVNV